VSLFFAGFLLLSCVQKEKIDNRVIDVASAMSTPVELKASDYYKKVRYIPLETNDSSLVGPDVSLQVLRNTILITTSQKQCLLFDKSSGKFLRTIGHVGNDPGGYRDVLCRVDEPGNRLFFPGWKNDIIVYDLNGKYMGKVDMPAIEGSETYPGDFFPLHKDTLIGYYSNMLGNELNRLLYFKENSKFISVIPNMENQIPFEIAGVSVWKGEKAVEKYGPFAADGLMFLEGKDMETASVNLIASSAFWRTGKGSYFKEAFNDTIYQVSGVGLLPSISFNLGEYAWNYQDRFHKNSDNRIYISQLLDRDDILFFRFITGLYNDSSRKLFNGVFNKKNGRTVINSLEKGIKDDLTNFMSFQPTTVSSSGEYAEVVSVDKILAWFDKHPEQISKLPEDVQILKKIDEEDNPVVIIWE